MTVPLGENFISNLKTDTQPSGYPKNWSEISAAFRKKRKYKCEKCGVDCSEYQRLVDTHHKNGDKSNCDYKNLVCLCKYHHSKEPHHTHYGKVVEEEDIAILKRLWEEQKIPLDKRT